MSYETSTLSQLSPNKVTRPGDELLVCCVHTMDTHASHNAMMVCPQCKQIIKCFEKENAYLNFVRFCESKHRKICTSTYKEKYVVVFHNFQEPSTLRR